MALYPNDAIGPFTTSNFTSMSDKKPDKGFSTNKVYNSVVFETEAGYEKRRLKSRRPKREYSLTYTNVTGLEKAAIESFYDNRAGEFESFTIDLAHLNEAGTLTVRFDGPLQSQHVLSGGSNVLQNFYNISFKLKETFD
jgi:hypothetical protein